MKGSDILMVASVLAVILAMMSESIWTLILAVVLTGATLIAQTLEEV